MIKMRARREIYDAASELVGLDIDPLAIAQVPPRFWHKKYLHDYLHDLIFGEFSKWSQRFVKIIGRTPEKKSPIEFEILYQMLFSRVSDDTFTERYDQSKIF